jgi:hypothetical protein
MGYHYVYNIDPYIHIITTGYYMDIWIHIVNIMGSH